MGMGINRLSGGDLFRWLLGIFLIMTFSFSTCKYSFKDTSPIPPEIKTFRVNYFENKARYVNPQLSPQLTEKMKQKVISNTRLRQTNDDNAHYDISGYVSQYDVSNKWYLRKSSRYQPFVGILSPGL
jgi:hypothetical protein